MMLVWQSCCEGYAIGDLSSERIEARAWQVLQYEVAGKQRHIAEQVLGAQGAGASRWKQLIMHKCAILVASYLEGRYPCRPSPERTFILDSGPDRDHPIDPIEF